MLADFMLEEDKKNEPEQFAAIANSSSVSISPPPTGGKKPKPKEEKEPTTGDTWTVKILKDIVYFVLAVMFMGVLAMLVATITLYIQSFNSKQATYQSLVDKVNTLIEQNNTKAEDEKTTKINILEQQIKDLKTNN